MDELIIKIKQHLTRKDGRLNNHRITGNISTENAQLISELVELTNFLDDSASIPQRWWHIKSNILYIPSCEKCGANTKFKDNRYDRYCSHNCAVTSIENSIRTSNAFKGKLVPPERVLRSKETRIKNGYYKDRESTIKKFSQSKQGANNPCYGKHPWNWGLRGAECPNYGTKKAEHTKRYGIDNNLFGKPAPKNAGRGVHGRFNNIHFRSSLELCYLIYWYRNNIEVVSAETKTFRVQYYDQFNNIRSYVPDYYIPITNELYEIKPKFFQTNTQVQEKFKTLIKYHTDKICKFGSGYELIDTIQDIMYNISQYIENNILIISESQLEKLEKNRNEIIRTIIHSL